MMSTMRLHNSQISRDRELRTAQTDAERKLWRHLRAGQANGHRFRRQQPIGPFLADFACLGARLIVEVDGGQHAENEHDRRRDHWFRSEGFTVLRYWNNDVLIRTEIVVEEIVRRLEQASSPSS
jgi:very-short-patch-repair endonuclease